MSVKPIETKYKGYRFRSRLEARTAILMDELGIKYIYEPEGFAFDDGTAYLPDFYLPDQDAFLECKGIMNEKDQHKLEKLAKETGKSIVIMYPDFRFMFCVWVDDDANGVHELFELGSWVCECKRCHKRYFGNADWGWHCQCCGYYDGDGGFEVLCHGYPEENWKDECKAIDKAKSARFEHGEAGG